MPKANFLKRNRAIRAHQEGLQGSFSLALAGCVLIPQTERSIRSSGEVNYTETSRRKLTGVGLSYFCFLWRSSLLPRRGSNARFFSLLVTKPFLVLRRAALRLNLYGDGFCPTKKCLRGGAVKTTSTHMLLAPFIEGVLSRLPDALELHLEVERAVVVNSQMRCTSIHV